MPPPTSPGEDNLPDPFDLQINALILVHRATLLGHDKVMLDLLLRLAEDFLSEGLYLAELSGKVPPCDRAGAPLDFWQLVLDTWDPSIRSAVGPPETFFETDEWLGHVQSTPKPLLGKTRHHFRLASHADAPRGRPRPTPAAAQAAAVVELVQHADESWQIVHAEVGEEHRRRGIATMLYDGIADYLSVRLGPSNWLTEDAYRLWERRQPDLVQAYRQHDQLPGLWLSPQAHHGLLAVATGKLLRSANENGRPN